MPAVLTLERAWTIANGQDFPVVAETERCQRRVLDHFARLLSAEKKSGSGQWSHPDVFKLHKVITHGEVVNQRSVRYRDMALRVGSFIPPPPETIPSLMSELLEWWNQKAPAVPAVIASAILHYRFEDIHPFADGNGRTGRALALWELYRRGFDSPDILSLNEHYWGIRKNYYAALRAVPQHGEDITVWLEYSAEGLRSTLARRWMQMRRTKNLRLRGDQ